MDQGSVRAFVLAAGLGSRLWPLTKYSPKMLLDLGDGTCLLDRHMKGLKESGCVARATVITGHLAAKVEARVEDRWNEFADTSFNPFFEAYGPLGSLWRVRDHMTTEDFLVANGDTLYRPQLVRSVLSAEGTIPDGVVLAVSAVTETHEDDVRVRLTGGRVTGVGKSLDATDFRSAGLLCVRGRASRRQLVAALDELIRDPSHLAPSSPWHELVNALVAAGTKVTAQIVDDRLWTEVDLHPDISELQRLIEKRVQADEMYG